MYNEAAKEAWEILFGVPFGKIVGWCAVAVAILSGVSFLVIKLYKIFLKYNSLRNENTEQKERLEKHEALFDELEKSLSEIKCSLKNYETVSFKQLKYTIIKMCEESIRDGFITAERLAYLEELYKDYVDIYNGNGYGKTLMKKVRSLVVVNSDHVT